MPRSWPCTSWSKHSRMKKNRNSHRRNNVNGYDLYVVRIIALKRKNNESLSSCHVGTSTSKIDHAQCQRDKNDVHTTGQRQVQEGTSEQQLEYEYANSKPCEHCANTLKKYNIHRVFYTTGPLNGPGSFEVRRVQDLETNHTSRGQKVLRQHPNRLQTLSSTFL